jgi:hypothetical protein
VDVLADPGTDCDHGEPEWRSYFRSTFAHNTVEIAGRSQSLEGGPFLWLRHAGTREVDVRDPELNWIAEHDGYTSLNPPARHRRSVRLDPAGRAIEITDVVGAAGHEVRLAFHLGPLVQARLDGTHADLAWPRAQVPGSARMTLPDGLEWSVHRGKTDPIAGWYSPGLGRREPAAVLVGTVSAKSDLLLITRMEFADANTSSGPASGAAPAILAHPAKTRRAV